MPQSKTNLVALHLTQLGKLLDLVALLDVPAQVIHNHASDTFQTTREPPPRRCPRQCRPEESSLPFVREPLWSVQRGPCTLTRQTSRVKTKPDRSTHAEHAVRGQARGHHCVRKRKGRAPRRQTPELLGSKSQTLILFIQANAVSLTNCSTPEACHHADALHRKI